MMIESFTREIYAARYARGRCRPGAGLAELRSDLPRYAQDLSRIRFKSVRSTASPRRSRGDSAASGGESAPEARPRYSVVGVLLRVATR
jgi:hypothetical protein